jgi:hypothetical protein
MTFTQVFGGTTIYPAGVSYRAVALSADQTLSWPTETATNSNVVSQIMDVTPSVGSLSIIMPPANEASVGETTLFFNAGSFAFTVKDNGGNTIVSIPTGLSYQVYLIGNSTVNGTWRSTQYAAGTSSATAGSLVGAGIKAIGTSLNQSMAVTTLNSNYTIGDADRSEAFVWSGGAGTLTLPSAITVGSDWFCQIRNSGTGAISATPTGAQLINGAASLAFNPGDSAIIICDGSNFFTIGFGQSASFAFDYVSIDLTSQASPYTLAGANLNRIAYTFGGTLAANMVINIPPTIQQYWLSNETIGGFSITVKVAGQTGVIIANGVRAICYCNGTDLVDADTSSFSFPVSVAQGGTGSTTGPGALINLGGTAVGRNVFTAATATDGRNALLAAASGANSDITSLSGLTTPLSAPQGGTGFASYAVGDILYASTTTALSKLADVATGNALISGGVGVAPSYGKIGLTTHISGTLAVGNGGTGATTAPAAITALGATTVGGNVFTLTNPSAITFPRFNADNTVSALDAATFRTAIGAGTSSTTGTVTSVGFTGGIVSVATATTTPAFTIAGTSGGVPYFSSGTTWATSAALAANALVVGGGAGAAPVTVTTGTGVVTALGVNTGTAGAFVVNGGALGTPSSGTLTNCTFPTLNQNTTGSAATLTTARTFTIGSTGKTFDGSASVSWTLGEIGAAASGANTDITALDQDITITATGTIAADTIGYRGLPQNAQTSAYTLALSDAGKHISITTGGVVVPANSSIAFPIGSTVIVYNDSAGSQNITITTDTMYLAGTATTGTRALAQRGLATLVKVAATTWVASGAGLT